MACVLIILTSLVVISSSSPFNEKRPNVAEDSLFKTVPESPKSLKVLHKRQAGGGVDENSPPQPNQGGPRNRTTGCPSKKGQGGMGQRGMGPGGMGAGGMGAGGMGRGGMGPGGMGPGGMGPGGMSPGGEGPGGMSPGGMGPGGMGPGGMSPGGEGPGGMGPGGMGEGGPRGPPPGMEDSSLVKTNGDNVEGNKEAYGKGGGVTQPGMGCGNFNGQINTGGPRRGPPQRGNMTGPPPYDKSG